MPCWVLRRLEFYDNLGRQEMAMASHPAPKQSNRRLHLKWCENNGPKVKKLRKCAEFDPVMLIVAEVSIFCTGIRFDLILSNISSREEVLSISIIQVALSAHFLGATRELSRYQQVRAQLPRTNHGCSPSFTAGTVLIAVRLALWPTTWGICGGGWRYQSESRTGGEPSDEAPSLGAWCGGSPCCRSRRDR